MQQLVTLSNVLPRIYGVETLQRVNLEIFKGENPVVIGPNGSGKSMLASLICGKISFSEGKMRFSFLPEGVTYKPGTIVKAGFESAYLMADYHNMYYQQRFSATENESAPTVDEILSQNNTDDIIIEKLRLKPLLKKRLIMLSSGELRRFLIASVLSKKPEIIIFDNPFIGLDVETCKDLNDVFEIAADFTNMIFLVSDINDIPRISKSVIPVKDLKVLPKISKEDFLKNFNNDFFVSRENHEVDCSDFFDYQHYENKDYENVAELTNINLSYPDKTIFNNLCWTIKRGEKWALQGCNGAGKSTLLSLLTADNPRAYSMDISLFDRKRGSGESIWDIKKKIGYISSEMHLFFRENQSCVKVAASGFFDTQGLFCKTTPQQNERALQILKMFNLEKFADVSFLKISDSMQRMVLLARTLIKNPDLLILDEPLHGLDPVNKQKAINIIETFCKQKGKTLIFVTHNENEIPPCVNLRFVLTKQDNKK